MSDTDEDEIVLPSNDLESTDQFSDVALGK